MQTTSTGKPAGQRTLGPPKARNAAGDRRQALLGDGYFVNARARIDDFVAK
jgi:hypothetical protein